MENMKYVVIVVIWAAAAIGYAFHDGSDPWVAAIIGTAIMAFM